MWKLTIEDDEGQQTSLDLSLGEYTIGRAEEASIRLTERNISRAHAVMRARGDVWEIEDVGSYNGTYINGERLSGTAHVKPGDVIQLGDYRVELLTVAEDATPDELPARQRRPDRLVMVIGPTPGAEYVLDGERLAIGRADEAQISVNHSSVSRLHAELHTLGESRWEVVDQGSSNGIRINGVELRRGIIEPGDALELGDVRLRFVAAGKYFKASFDASQQLPAVVPFESDGAPGKGGTSRLRTVMVAVVLLAGVVGLVAVLVGGPGASGTDTGSAARPMATSEAEAKSILQAALEIADEDIVRAHHELERIPESSAVRDSDDFTSIEDRWADAMFAKAETSSDVEDKRRIYNQISDATGVSPDKRKQAAQLALALGPANTRGAPPHPRVGGGPRPRTTATVKSTRATATAATSSAPASVKTGGDKRFDEKAQKRMLYGKAAAGHASETELRMLKAICMNDGDRACRNMAVARLKELRSKKKSQ